MPEIDYDELKAGDVVKTLFDERTWVVLSVVERKKTKSYVRMMILSERPPHPHPESWYTPVRDGILVDKETAKETFPERWAEIAEEYPEIE